MATLTAVVQDTAPPRVLLTADQLGSTPSTITIWRDVAGTRGQVRGAVDLTVTGQYVAVDNEAPFGVDVSYVLIQHTVAGTEVTVISDIVRLEATLPWLTNPITGDGVSVTIVDWPELSYASRMSVLPVAGRVRPVVVSDIRTSAVSTMVILTRTRLQLLDLRRLLAGGDVILLRPVCDAVEGDYLAVGDVVETRYKPQSGAEDPDPAGQDWRRLVTMDLTAVDQPSPAIPAVGDTLDDLSTFVPGTLADIASTWPPPNSLLTIARTTLKTGGP